MWIFIWLVVMLCIDYSSEKCTDGKRLDCFPGGCIEIENSSMTECGKCRLDQQCHGDYVCEGGNCVIISITNLEINIYWYQVFGFIIVFGVVAISAVAGFGGGSLIISTLLAVGQYNLSIIAPMTTSVVFGASLSAVLLNLLRKHPIHLKLGRKRPVSDWDFVTTVQPIVLSGTLVGSLFNAMFPTWLTILAVLFVNCFSFCNVTWKGVRMFFAERNEIGRNKAEIENQGEENCENDEDNTKELEIMKNGDNGLEKDIQEPENDDYNVDFRNISSASIPEPVEYSNDEESQHVVDNIESDGENQGRYGNEGENENMRTELEEGGNVEEENTDIIVEDENGSSSSSSSIVVNSSENSLEEGERIEIENFDLSVGTGTHSVVSEESSLHETPRKKKMKEERVVGNDSEKKESIRRILNFYDSIQIPIHKICFLFFSWVVVLLVSLFKGSKLVDSVVSVEACSAVYWVIIFLAFPLLIIQSYGHAIFLFLRYSANKKSGYQELYQIKEDFKWNLCRTIFVPICFIMSGVVASLIGTGGGLINAPLMITLGLHTDVVPPTNFIMIFITSSSNFVQFLISRKIKGDYALLCAVIGFIAAICGKFSTGFILRKAHGRRSVIVLLLSFLIVIATIASLGIGIYKIVVSSENMGFKSPC